MAVTFVLDYVPQPPPIEKFRSFTWNHRTDSFTNNPNQLKCQNNRLRHGRFRPYRPPQVNPSGSIGHSCHCWRVRGSSGVSLRNWANRVILYLWGFGILIIKFLSYIDVRCCSWWRMFLVRWSTSSETQRSHQGCPWLLWWQYSKSNLWASEKRDNRSYWSCSDHIRPSVNWFRDSFKCVHECSRSYTAWWSRWGYWHTIHFSNFLSRLATKANCWESCQLIECLSWERW